MSKYDLPDGLSQPALRALAGAGISNLKQLSRFTEAEVAALHGIGPKGITILRRALREQGLAFKPKAKPK